MNSFFIRFFAIFCIASFFGDNYGLENGLARTPPMGWNSWVAFYCEVDCDKHPLTCISERQITAMADRMVQDGYRDAGYQFVIIDDCWPAPERDAQGRLQPDPKRFSKGIKWLADYVHNKSLKFGIYEDVGTKTCDGYPGSQGHAEVDAKTFASWGADYLKVDGCYANESVLNEEYPAFRKALNETGREIVYSCEWPLYMQTVVKKSPDYKAIRENCNLWRNYIDSYPSWDSLLITINYFDEHQEELIPISGPGGWNDPDLLVIGKPGVSVDQAKVQMALWAMWSAPLVISVDLRFIAEPYKRILQNKGVIAIDQDPLGIMGRLVIKTHSVNVYLKPVTPVDTATGDHSYAIAFLNKDLHKQANVTVRRLEQLGLRHAKGYVLEELFQNKVIFPVSPTDSLVTLVEPTGVTMYKATVVL